MLSLSVDISRDVKVRTTKDHGKKFQSTAGSRE